MSFIKKNMWSIGFVVILGGALLAMALASKNTGLPSPTAVAKDTVEFVIASDDHVEGPSDAKATLVEFGDFQCPACGAYYPFVEKLHTEFPNDLRIVFRHFPLKQLHFQAMNSAEVAEAASLQGKFWEMYRQLYEHQKEWSNTAGKGPFEKYATAIGLDLGKFKQDADSSSVNDRINRDSQYGIDIGINGTPTFYLNGKKIVNPQSYEEFKALIVAQIGGTSASASTTETIQLGS